MPGQEPHGLSEAAELGELTPQQQVPPPGLSDVSRVRRLALRAICCHALAPGLRKALLRAAAKGLGSDMPGERRPSRGRNVSGQTVFTIWYVTRPSRVTVKKTEEDTHY